MYVNLTATDGDGQRVVLNCLPAERVSIVPGKAVLYRSALSDQLLGGRIHTLLRRTPSGRWYVPSENRLNQPVYTDPALMPATVVVPA